MSASMLWAAGHGLVLALLAWVLRDWGRARADIRRRAAGGSVAVAVTLIASAALFHWVTVPIGWITILQEGRTMRNVQQLYGLAAHSGTGFTMLIDWLTDHDVATLPAVVAANLTLWAVNAILFVLIADATLCIWWASLAFTVAYAANANTVHAAFSETPAMLWSSYFWLGCIAGSAIDDEAHVSPTARRITLVCVALLALLAALLRVELLVIAAPAVTIACAKVFGWEAWMRRAARAALGWLAALIGGPLWAFVMVVAALLLLDRLPWSLQTRWFLAGVQPVNFSFLSLPLRLAVFLPWGMIALFVLGLIYAVRRWVGFVLLPFTVIMLFKVYASASHGAFFEIFRYLTFLTPVVCFLALFGFRELAAWAARWAWPPWWRRIAVLVFALTFTVWNPPGASKELFGRGQQLSGLTPMPRPIAALSVPLLGWNQQTEVRYLLDLIARYPSCVFVVKATRADATFDASSGFRWAVIGRPVPRYRELADDERSPAQVADALAPGAPCVLFYRGLDCNLADTDGCRAEIDGRAPLEERVLENLPYNDIKEYGAHRAEIHLGVYPIVWPVRPAAAP